MVDDHANVRNVSTQIPSDKITRNVVSDIGGRGEIFSLSTEEHHQVSNAPMIDVGVGMEELPSKVIRVTPEIGLHVLVNFFLQIDADGAINSNDLVVANTGVCGHVAVGIRDTNGGRLVPHRVVGAFNGSSREFLRECDPGRVRGSSVLSGC